MVDTLRFDGRVAVVTGAGRGLGRAHARLLAARGARVVVNDVGLAGGTSGTPSAQAVVAEITDAGGEAVADLGDVGTDAGAKGVVATALAAFGRVHIVVANAGVHVRTLFQNCERSDFDRVMDVNVGGVWAVTQAAWPYLCDQGYGRVVMTTSAAGLFGSLDSVAYATSKSAVIGMMRSLAVIGEGSGVMVNALSPGAWTPLMAELTDADGERRAYFAQYWSAELVSPVVAALSHEQCPFTGQIVSAIRGHVSRVFIGETVGIEFDRDFTPEAFLGHLSQICDEDGYTVPTARPMP